MISKRGWTILAPGWYWGVVWTIILLVLPGSTQGLLLPHTRNSNLDSYRFRQWTFSSLTRLLFAHDPSHESKMDVEDGVGANEKTVGCAAVHDVGRSAWQTLVDQIALVLLETNSTSSKELSGMEGTSTGWGNWIDEKTALELQHTILDRLELAPPADDENLLDKDMIVTRYQSRRWLNWMLQVPKPFVWDLSLPLQLAVAHQVMESRLENGKQTTTSVVDDITSIPEDVKEIIGQVSCRIFAIPSGQTLSRFLDTPVGAMVYGKVLSGGVERFRLLGSTTASSSRPLRKVGQRTQIALPISNIHNPNQTSVKNPCWLQYGGSRRSYQALDVGPCLVWELSLSPKANEMALMGAQLNTISVVLGDDNKSNSLWTTTSLKDYDEMSTLVSPLDMTQTTRTGGVMNILQQLFVIQSSQTNSTANGGQSTMGNPEKDDLWNLSNSSNLQSMLQVSLGGLRPQINEIVRRVLDGRLYFPYYEDNNTTADTSNDQGQNGNSVLNSPSKQDLSSSLWELGIKPVRGLLLYGKPGCGKTLLAREICRLIRARPPKIVAAPDLLDKWVGGTEAMVRQLFVDAEQELLVCRGDFTRSSLHVIVIDECDALFRKRSSLGVSSEVTRASAVNQILSKLDGVQALDNVLLIAMTNRKELLDPALLRPGRLEVQVECPLPDVQGRREILQILLDGFRRANRLSQPLLESIYSPPNKEERHPGLFVRAKSIWNKVRFRSAQRDSDRERGQMELVQRIGQQRVDLALDRYTKGFSGADLAGLVRCAGSLSLARWRNQKNQDVDDPVPNDKGETARGAADGTVLEGLTLTLPDMLQALDEIKSSAL